MLNEAITNNACCSSIWCSAEQEENSEASVSCPVCDEKCQASLIEAHADISLCKENRVIFNIIIYGDESEDKSCVGNCEMEIQKEKVFR